MSKIKEQNIKEFRHIAEKYPKYAILKESGCLDSLSLLSALILLKDFIAYYL